MTHRSQQRGDTLQSPLCRVVLRPRGRWQLSVTQSHSQTVSQSVRHLVSWMFLTKSFKNRWTDASVQCVAPNASYLLLLATLSHLLATVASCFVVVCHQKPKVDFFFKLSPELPHSAINCGHCESSLSLSTCEFSVENVNFTYATYFSRGLARLAF